METGHERQIFQALEKSIRQSETGLRLLHVVSGPVCFPPDDGMMQTVNDCKALGIDVLSLEADGRRLLVAGQVYDDVFAVALLEENMPMVTAARYLQRQLAADSLLQPEEQLLPASDVAAIMGQWEWQVSLIFGPRFAARLMETAPGPDSRGCMTSESLDRVRRRLIRVTCGSVDFTEST